MNLQTVIAGSIAMAFGALLLSQHGPEIAPRAVNNARDEPVASASFLATADDLGEARRRAAEEAEDRRVRHAKRMQEIDEEHAARQAQTRRRLKEIDYQYQKDKWDIEANARRRDEDRRKREAEYNDAELTRQNQWSNWQREEAQRRSDEAYAQRRR